MTPTQSNLLALVPIEIGPETVAAIILPAAALSLFMSQQCYSIVILRSINEYL
jgi:hypothetical protein